MAIIISILIALGIVSSSDQINNQVIQDNKSIIMENTNVGEEDILELL